MTTDREVMQMALDALIEADERDGCRTYKEEIEAIRVALAKGEQEPKPQAWMLITESGACGGIFRFRYDAEVQARELGSRFSIVPLYGAPIAASDISAEPVAKSEESRQVPVAWAFPNTAITGSNRWMLLQEKFPADDQYGGAMWVPLFMREEEPRKDQANKALRSAMDKGMAVAKKLIATPEQEPVAWKYETPAYVSLQWKQRDDWRDGNWTALYTAPPQRPWQGLTDEEAAACWSTSAVETWKRFEAAIKEKNT